MKPGTLAFQFPAWIQQKHKAQMWCVNWTFEILEVGGTAWKRSSDWPCSEILCKEARIKVGSSIRPGSELMIHIKEKHFVHEHQIYTEHVAPKNCTECLEQKYMELRIVQAVLRVWLQRSMPCLARIQIASLSSATAAYPRPQVINGTGPLGGRGSCSSDLKWTLTWVVNPVNEEKAENLKYTELLQHP